MFKNKNHIWHLQHKSVNFGFFMTDLWLHGLMQKAKRQIRFDLIFVICTWGINNQPISRSRYRLHSSTTINHFILQPLNICSFARTKSISSGAQHVTLRNYFSHPSLVMYSFQYLNSKEYITKLKLRQQIGGGLLIANHLDQPLWYANQTHWASVRSYVKTSLFCFSLYFEGSPPGEDPHGVLWWGRSCYISTFPCPHGKIF